MTTPLIVFVLIGVLVVLAAVMVQLRARERQQRMHERRASAYKASIDENARRGEHP
jgi:hypothetical protein